MTKGISGYQFGFDAARLLKEFGDPDQYYFAKDQGGVCIFDSCQERDAWCADDREGRLELFADDRRGYWPLSSDAPAVPVTTADVCAFFAARASGFDGTLGERELPVAVESFAFVPLRVEGDVPIVRVAPDVTWKSNFYEVMCLPEDSSGIVLERVSSMDTLWRFEGRGGNQWVVTSPSEWRIKNALTGEREGIGCSTFGPYQPD